MIRILEKTARRFWHHHILQYLLVVPVAAERRRQRARDRGAVLAEQSARLRSLVRAAHAHIPYYRQLLDELGISPADIDGVGQLHLLPFLERDDLQDFLPLLMARNRSTRWCRLRTTSGTTGRPLLIPRPPESILDEYGGMEWRYDLMGLARDWLRPLGVNYVYVSDTEYNPDLRNYALRLPALRMSTFRKYDLRQDDREAALRLLRDIHRHRPVILAGKPSSLFRLAELSRRHDPDRRYPLSARALVTGAEQLLPAQRAMLEETFGGRVFDHYGLTETGVIGCECPLHDGLHYRDDRHLVEIVRDDERVEPGESGEIVVTDLVNRMMPLIRYRTGDIGRVTYESCACGSQYPRISLIEGRIVDFFQTPFGESINPFVLLGDLPALGLRQYQLVQRAVDEILVRYVGEQPAEIVAAAVQHAAVQYFGQTVRVSARVVTSLDEPGRKTRLYVNETGSATRAGCGQATADE